MPSAWSESSADGGCLLDGTERKISHASVQHQREGYRHEADYGPLDGELDRLFHARTQHSDDHARAGLAPERNDGLVGKHGIRCHAIDLDESVPRADAHALARASRDRAHYGDILRTVGDLESYAAVLTLGAYAEVLVVRCLDEGGVRVPQPTDDAVDGGVVDRLPVDLLHKAGLDAIHHFLKHPDADVHVVRAVDAALQ